MKGEKMEKWNKTADKETIEKTIKSLKENGINVLFVETKEEAKKKVLGLVPERAEVFDMTSVTLETLGVLLEISESGNYDSIRNKLNSMNRQTQSREMRKLGASPDYAIGSCHAITEDGKIMIASNTGSQLPAYVYGAGKVIFVAGAQKIVKNLDQGFKRMYEYTLPLESERAKKAYGIPGSAVNKILIVNKEIQPDRINLIIVNEVLGF
ncbi:lactate utilization protein [Candidatus Pacearchaeota archaeon]|nr:lactate utilization protein [Candidatus Pacearchaeota archaeon]